MLFKLIKVHFLVSEFYKSSSYFVPKRVYPSTSLHNFKNQIITWKKSFPYSLTTRRKAFFLLEYAPNSLLAPSTSPCARKLTTVLWKKLKVNSVLLVSASYKKNRREFFFWRMCLKKYGLKSLRDFVSVRFQSTSFVLVLFCSCYAVWWPTFGSWDSSFIWYLSDRTSLI